MELDSLYQEVILEHYKRPLHKSLKANPTIQVQHLILHVAMKLL